MENQQAENIRAFREALAANEDVAAAFRGAFPDLAQKVLDQELTDEALEALAGGGSITGTITYDGNVPPPGSPPSSRPLRSR